MVSTTPLLVEVGDNAPKVQTQLVPTDDKEREKAVTIERIGAGRGEERTKGTVIVKEAREVVMFTTNVSRLGNVVQTPPTNVQMKMIEETIVQDVNPVAIVIERGDHAHVVQPGGLLTVVDAQDQDRDRSLKVKNEKGNGPVIETAPAAARAVLILTENWRGLTVTVTMKKTKQMPWMKQRGKTFLAFLRSCRSFHFFCNM